jgi:hypothetical protein
MATTAAADRARESGAYPIYTRFAQMIGTPLYMSPEQVEINAAATSTAWACCCTSC